MGDIDSQLWNPRTCSRIETSLKDSRSPSALVLYSLRFPHAHWCYSDKTETISSMLRKTALPPLRKKETNRVIPHLILS